MKITIWKKYSVGDRVFLHNHIEDGWLDSNTPTILFKSQNVWKNERWEKNFGYLLQENNIFPRVCICPKLNLEEL